MLIIFELAFVIINLSCLVKLVKLREIQKNAIK